MTIHLPLTGVRRLLARRAEAAAANAHSIMRACEGALDLLADMAAGVGPRRRHVQGADANRARKLLVELGVIDHADSVVYLPGDGTIELPAKALERLRADKRALPLVLAVLDAAEPIPVTDACHRVGIPTAHSRPSDFQHLISAGLNAGVLVVSSTQPVLTIAPARVPAAA